MDCNWIARDDVFEAYARDALAPDDREAFEEHYFACVACFEKARTYQALHAELAAAPAFDAATPVRYARWQWAVVPAGALLLLAAGVAFWPRPPASLPGAPTKPAATARDAAVAPSAAQAAGQAEGRSTAPAVPTPAAPPVVALGVLARVEPPVYIPVSLRAPRSEAGEKFDEAMRRYVEGDYAAAIPGLRTAVDLKPDSAQYTFFLAVCQLLVGQVDSSIAGLGQTVALGDSPYLEEAHFYLAKARLRQGDLRAARGELQRVIERRGRFEATARALLAQVDAQPGR